MTELTIDDRLNTHYLGQAGPSWTNNGGDGAGVYLLTTGPGSVADVYVSEEPDGKHRIVINERFPSLGYDGLETEELETAMRLVNQWWSICMHLIATSYDYRKFPELDLDELKDQFLIR